MNKINGKDDNGFFVVDEDGTKYYLKTNKEKYIELMKKFNLNTKLNERMSSKAKQILWKYTDYE